MAEPSGDPSLLASLSGVLERFRSLHAEAVSAYGPIVENIIETGCKDVDHIEHTLDGLLSFCDDEAALSLFKRLCRYYWDIDPAATAQQVYAYREMFDTEADGNVGD